MLFNSLEFAVFFFIVYSLYLLLKHRGQNIMLLLASYVFYGAWDWRFLFLIWISTFLDFFCAQKIFRTDDKGARKKFLIISICGNLIILGFFKYYDFFAESLRSLLALFGLHASFPLLHIILPVGISFYTFQTMSYTIDIYNRKLPATDRFFDFALFVAYFPQLVAGPIERARHLLPQILGPRQVTYDKFCRGCRLILWGLFKKVVVADRLALYVDSIYGHIYLHQGFTFLLATFFFAFQIYCDFSAYSDIARGLGRMMGFDIMVNFRAPYFARNIREFWQKWHISLSTWLRDYLYIPLGGSRRGRLNTYRNIFITMFLGGLWHGANWKFVIWGFIHGVYIAIDRFTQEISPSFKFLKKRPGAAAGIFNAVFTFSAVLATWVFFRSPDLKSAMYIIKNTFIFPARVFVGSGSIIFGAFGMAVLILMDLKFHAEPNGDVLSFNSGLFRWAVYYFLIFSIILSGVRQGEQFIYFQF